MIDVPESNWRSDADARRLVVEALSVLAYIKKDCADRILRPAKIPEDLITKFLTERHPATGAKRSKREASLSMLDELANRGIDLVIVHQIIEICSRWDSFHLAQDEYKARAVVQKSRELSGRLAEAAAREREEHERCLREAADLRKREKIASFRRESALLLAQFDQASIDVNKHDRGYLLEDLLNRAFLLHGINAIGSFKRNARGEQIDGAFAMDGWHYIVECRWRERLSDIRQLDGLSGQVGRSGRQTMGVFLSIGGWSKHVVPLLKQNSDKAIILMEGYDLRVVLDQGIDMKRLLRAKLAVLNLRSEPYYSIADLLKESI